MTKDESPADVAANNAAPQEDETPRGESPAEPSAAPARRRRNTTAAAPRAPRGKKNTPSSPEAEPSPEPVIQAAVEAPPAPVETPTEAPPEKPAKPARRRAPRKTAAATTETASEPVSDAPITEISDIGTIPTAPEAPTPPQEIVEAAPAARPARRRTTRRKTAEEPAAVIETEAPVVEAQAEPLPTVEEAPATDAMEAKPASTRRRTSRGRGRGRADKTTPETETPAPEEAQPVAAEVPAETAEGEPVPARRRRTTTRKAPVEVEDLTLGARVLVKRGMPELHIKGEVYPPVFFFGNIEGPREAQKVASEVKRAAQAGVHIHSTLVELPCPLPPDDSVYETLDNRIETLLDADPRGFAIPRLVFVPAPGWRKQYPNEVNHYADGSTDDPSIASNHFWSEAEHALTALVEHIGRMTYGERVIGYHLERGEWFHPKDGGYDRSYANREAFRNWLRNKYKNSEAALRAAWYDGQVQFYTAEIPPMPAAARQEMAFFEPRKERRWIDFLEYTSEVTADRLISLASVIKKASQNRALVSVCYGYTFEFGHTFSGHLALGRLLESPSIDLVAGPPSYRDRQTGGAGSFPGPVQSVGIHGKIWVSEDDTKTHLAPGGDSPDDFNPKIDSRFGTDQVHQRAIGKVLAAQSGVSWMDSWGEGWLDAGEVWDRISKFTERYREYLKVRKPVSPDVVVLVDERSLLHLQRGENFVRRLLQEQVEIIQRSGASVGFYLQSDLTARNFPVDAKLYLFMTPYRVPAEQRAAIREKLQKDGKTLVWMYAAGVADQRGEPVELVHDLVGITVRQQSWNSEIGSRITDTRHPITDNIQNRNVGVRERINPSFYVDDDTRGINILGEYHQSGLPSIAVRQMDGWRSVFCGEPTLTADLLRGLCRYAGVHLYSTGGDDYVFAGNGWLTFHAIKDGHRTILLPRETGLYDLTEGKFLGDQQREYRTFLKGRTTHSFFVGTPDEMRKLGLPGVERPVRGRRKAPISSPQPALPEAEAETESTGFEMLIPAEPTSDPAQELSAAAIRDLLSAPSDDTALDSADNDTDDIDDDEGDDTDDAEGSTEAGSENGTSDAAAEQRRRRRRRGGRGRGRRGRPGAPSGEGGAPPPAE
jgi:hypothetical protein